MARQVAALPYAVVDGEVKTLLITSRETGRWVIPKGWPMENLADHDAAAQEALEEAGVTGTVAAEEIGSYDYDKRLGDGRLKPCRVAVYLLRVTDIRDEWKESGERTRKWVCPGTAATMVNEPALAQLFQKLHRDGAAD